MAQCTAPYQGHRTSSGQANCPVCGVKNSFNSQRSYGYTQVPSKGYGYNRPYTGRNVVSRSTRAGASVSYNNIEWRVFEPFAQKAEEQAQTHPERKDLFLCHAWDDRQGSAKELYSHLKENGASVWFSEEDLPLGSLMIREIDRGLRNSRVGIVLVTPSLLESIESNGVAEKELAVLLSSRRVIPVLHETTFDELNNVSPMLASHAGLNTSDSSLSSVATKIAAAAAALPSV